MADLIPALRGRWRHQREYAERLTADIPDGRMLAQPIAGIVMNHPAWIISHLAAYPPVLGAMLRREPAVDPIDHPHGRKSRPSIDPLDYPPKAELIAGYLALHDDLDRALADVDRAVLGEAPAFERWRARFPTMGDLVVHLVVHHESLHLGQLSAWRRAMGMPPV